MSRPACQSSGPNARHFRPPPTIHICFSLFWSSLAAMRASHSFTAVLVALSCATAALAQSSSTPISSQVTKVVLNAPVTAVLYPSNGTTGSISFAGERKRRGLGWDSFGS